MESKIKFRPNPDLKLMSQILEVLRYHHYAYRTEKSYCQWILRFIHFFGGKTQTKYLSSFDIKHFLSDLAVQKEVSASTQRQALDAIIFLYREVLDKQNNHKKKYPTKNKRQFPTGANLDKLPNRNIHIRLIFYLMI